MSEDLTPDDVRQLKIALGGLGLLAVIAIVIAIVGPKSRWATAVSRFCVSVILIGAVGLLGIVAAVAFVAVIRVLFRALQNLVER